MLIVLGDSNTTGFGLSALNQSWMQLAAQSLGTTYVSLGVNSSTLQAVEGNYNNCYDRRYLLADAVNTHPGSTAILYVGTADIVWAMSDSRYEVGQYAAQLRKLLRLFTSVVVIEPNTVTVPGIDGNLVLSYQQTTKAVAMEFCLPFVGTSDLTPVDGIHHGSDNQRIIAQRVALLLG